MLSQSNNPFLILHPAKLPNNYAWAFAHLIKGLANAACCLSFGSKSKAFLCGHHSACTISRSKQALELRSKLFLKHLKCAKVMFNDNSVCIICRFFHALILGSWVPIISITHKAHDKAFTEVMCLLFASDWLILLLSGKKLKKTQAFPMIKS